MPHALIFGLRNKMSVVTVAEKILLFLGVSMLSNVSGLWDGTVSVVVEEIIAIGQ